jgi:phosphoribosylanthranilate isomerase
MTWVKICGTTNLEDALIAVEAGADAIGFVFYEKSPRYVSLETVREIVAGLPDAVEKIGVLVVNDDDPIRALLHAGLTGTQTYFLPGGKPVPGAAKAVGISLLPPRHRSLVALPMNLLALDHDGVERAAADFANWDKRIPPEANLRPGMFDTFVLDSGNLQQPGGTGKPFNWEKAAPIAEGMRQGGLKLVVAGGLTPENVGEAIGILHPWGVDVVSGVEGSPGKKDPEKVRAFVKAVRDIDGKSS